MGYDGWLEFNGVELVNLSRAAQLAQGMGIDAVYVEPGEVQWIADELGGTGYETVANAPWYDAGHTPSAEFAGFIPLSVTGLDDSSLEASTTEYITDGGRSDKPRNSTKPIVMNFAIVARTDRGADYGKRWLDRVLRGSTDKTFCSGSDLRYFQHVPWGEDEIPKVHMRNVRLTRGTSVTRKRRGPCSSVWFVTFTMTADDPFEYGEDIGAVADLGGIVKPPPPDDVVPDRINLASIPDARSMIPFPFASGGVIAPLGNALVEVETGVSIPAVPWVETAVTRPTGFDVGDNEIQWSSGEAGDGFPVEPGDQITVSVYQYHQQTGGSLASAMGIRLVAQSQTGAIISTTNFPGPAGVADTWQRCSATLTIPSGASHLWIVAYGSDTLVGTLKQTAMLVEYGNSVGDYFDGDKPPVSSPGTWTAFGWEGVPGISQSIQYSVESSITDSDSITLIETTCPVYDYSPIYDPLHPALVPSPTAPDFYPEGWDIVPGMTFDRFWARVESPGAGHLYVVPKITLTSPVEARLVRVAIWPNDSEDDDQCDPLFAAVVSYLPGGVLFTIDGERKASYVWDGLGDSVRRTDSLVYGLDATPIQWASFNDPDGLLITLDLFSESGVDNSEVRASVVFTPKSD